MKDNYLLVEILKQTDFSQHLKKACLSLVLALFFSGCIYVQAQTNKEFSVYSDKFDAGSASGRMGAKNASGLKTDPLCTESPFRGTHCLKITADGTEPWSGVSIQYNNDWRKKGDKGPFANLIPYKYLVFYARSDKNYSIAKLGMGGVGEYPKEEGKVPLTTEWKRYIMELGPGKRDSVNSLFLVIFEGAGTIYLDDIKYVDKIEPEKTDVVYLERKTPMDSTAYYVYADKFINGIPTGYFGSNNGSSVKIDPDWKENPYEGPKCIKVEVKPSETYRGLHFHFTGKWAAGLTGKEELPDLTKYKKMVFYIRTDKDPLVIPEIGVGTEAAGEEKESDTFIEATKEWKKVEVNIKGRDLSRVNTVFFMVLPVGTFYLDEIRFVKK